MKRIVFAVIGLLALFTVLRVHGEAAGVRYALHPGLLEIQTADGSARIAFGLLDRSKGNVWNLFPLRVSLGAGRQSLSLSLNGLSLLAPAGRSFGRPVRVTGRREGDLVSFAGPVTVEGRVTGDVWCFGADIRLGPRAVVTGDVVALGGRVLAERGAQIRGNKHSLPNVRIPLLRLLASPQSAAALRALVELMGIVLYLLLLFLAVHFAGGPLQGLAAALASQWRGALLHLALSVLLIPLAAALLVATIVGIFLVPALGVAVLALAYLGYLGATVRLGSWLRGGEPAGGPASIYTAGLLGLLVIKGPALLGILLGLLSAELFRGIGRVLFVVGSVETAVAAAYGFGGTLRCLRVSRPPA